MTACLLFGASGMVGSRLLPRLREARIEVIAVSRQPRPAQAGVHWLQADLHAPLAPPAGVDAIISCGPLDAFARWHAQARPAATRVVALGSMSLDSKRTSADAAERALAARLQAAEDELFASAAALGASALVLRPTLIYGSGQDRSLARIARFARRWRMYPRLYGATGLRQPVHADDLALACTTLLGMPELSRRSYPLGGGERLSCAQMIERTCVSLGIGCLPIPLPVELLGSALAARLARAMGWGTLPAAVLARLREDLVADHGEAERDFGWAPRLFEPAAADWPPTG